MPFPIRQYRTSADVPQCDLVRVRGREYATIGGKGQKSHRLGRPGFDSGPVGQAEELTSRSIVSMTPAGTEDDHHARYTGSLQTEHAGRYGFTVRVVPRHPDLVSSAELGLAAWA